MAKIIASLDEINFGVDDTKIDVLGNAYEYLIGQFAATAGKKAGEFYTPSGPAELLCRLACLGLTDVKHHQEVLHGKPESLFPHGQDKANRAEDISAIFRTFLEAERIGESEVS